LDCAYTGRSRRHDEPRGSTQTVIQIKAAICCASNILAKSSIWSDSALRNGSRFTVCRTVPEYRCCYPYARRTRNVSACDRENGMARRLSVASGDPPRGPPVPGWLPRQLPSLVAMSGRFCRVEPIDSTRHGEALYAAYATDREGHLWTYLPWGP